MIDEKFFRAVVGSRIRYLRTLRQMPQQALAAAAGMDSSKLCKIESGTQKLDSRDAVLVSEALDMSLDELLAMPSSEETS